MAVRQRGGRWYTIISVKDPATGKRRNVWKVVPEATTKAEAQRAERATRVTLDTHHALPSTATTLGDYMDRWLLQFVDVHCKPSTRMSYHETVRVHLRPALGAIKLNNLTVGMLNNYIAAKTKEVREGRREPLSAKSIRYHVQGELGSCLSYAVSEGRLMANPCERVTLPKVENRQPTFWTGEQAKAFLAAAFEAPADRYALPYLVTLTTGMRQGEVFGLPWRCLDLEAGTLAVTQNVQRRNFKALPGWTGDAKVSFGTPKTEAGVRVTPLLPGGRVAGRYKIERERRGWSDVLVFPKADGSPEDTRNVDRRHFAPLVARVEDLPRIRFHDLRHSAASFLHHMGVPQVTIARIMGWSDAAFGLRTYIHGNVEQDRAAVSKMVAILPVMLPVSKAG